MPTISVIVPVYNAERWLRRCVDSILAQTFTDFELLLIDDGSTDGSPAICDAYAAADPRVRAFHKPNGGVRSARNLGLDHARAPWITFVDSDDWIEPDTFSKVLSVPDIESTDLIVFSFKVEGNNARDFSADLPAGRHESESLRNLLIDYGISAEFTGVCCKLFRSQTLHDNNIRFSTGIDTHEDTLFFLSYLAFVNAIDVIPEKLYHYLAYNGLSRNLDNASSQLPLILRLYNEKFDALRRFGFPDSMRVKFRHSIAWLSLCHVASIKSPFKIRRFLQTFLREPTIREHFASQPPESRLNRMMYKAIASNSPAIATIALLFGRRLRPKAFLL